MHRSKERGEGILERERSGWEGETVGCSRVTSVWCFPSFSSQLAALGKYICFHYQQLLTKPKFF